MVRGLFFVLIPINQTLIYQSLNRSFTLSFKQYSLSCCWLFMHLLRIFTFHQLHNLSTNHMENTKFKAFLPHFYLVWSDDLLTQKELASFREFIDNQNWLSDEEQEKLLANINISTPPSRPQLNKWKAEIEEGLKNLPEAKDIFDISVWLSDNNPDIIAQEQAFTALETQLGLSGEEAIGQFKTLGNSFTSVHHTVSSFDTAKLTQILDGNTADIIKKSKKCYQSS